MLALVLLTWSCQPESQSFDLLIINAQVLDGSGAKEQALDVGILGDTIAWIGKRHKGIEALKTLDAKGMYLTPGFIDPHTHALRDLRHPERKSNVNYLTQGVTTVVVGNDGGGPVKTAAAMAELDSAGIGTNAAFMVGHNSIRRQVMRNDKRAPNAEEMEEMKKMVRSGMEAGALGLSSGLFYAPASFSETEEVIELAKVAGEYGGYYDVHMRDESSYNIGLLGAVKETIEIARKANVPGNIAHVKALGVDVWGQSKEIIELIESARAEGLVITADQYPFEASSTSLAAALIPRWVMADAINYRSRLDDPLLLDSIKSGMEENLRRRGGPEAVLFIAAADTTVNGRTLAEVADLRQLSPVEAAIMVEKSGGSAIASFNMQDSDIKALMAQPWVMTSSDGGSPHPRKYASFPRKIQKYVLQEGVLSLAEMVHRSTAFTAQSIGITKRGSIQEGYFADLIVFDPAEVNAKSTYAEPVQLSEGISYVVLNGKVVMENGAYNETLAGRCLRK